MCRQMLTSAIVGMAQFSLPKNGMRSSPIQEMNSLTMPIW